MQRRTRGDGGLYKRADGLWIGAVEISSPDGGRKRRTVSSKDKGTALNKLRALRAEVEAGRIPSSSKTTVAQWLAHWLETIHAPQVRPTTYRYYEQVIRLYLVPALGDKRLDRLTPEDIRGMHRVVQQTSTRNAQKAHQVLQKALADAQREGVVGRNVVLGMAKPKHAAAERMALSASEVKHLLRTTFENGDPLATRWAAAFLTGARQGELLGLTWDRVDLDAGVLDFAWQLQQLYGTLPAGFEYRPCHKALMWTRPKSHAGKRAVPITDALRELLRTRHAGASGPNPHNLVWHHPDGRPVSPREDFQAWKQLLARAGMESVPLHSARHTAASMLQGAGVAEETRMRIMGHSSVQAQRGYVHVDQSQARAAVAMLDGLLQSPADGGEASLPTD
ncbi:tyrosine-type recombinase/integrase [Mycobacteroides immunogenum]|uniref:tyrosine-type recombinase/integrase n=1 Tax=Mycobacteroides immunogenum TaxID=83262 RepID=UPI0007E466B5|nr:site-specific integrase [Mycobacteroides immunogenum]